MIRPSILNSDDLLNHIRFYSLQHLFGVVVVNEGNYGAVLSDIRLIQDVFKGLHH